MAKYVYESVNWGGFYTSDSDDELDRCFGDAANWREAVSIIDYRNIGLYLPNMPYGHGGAHSFQYFYDFISAEFADVPSIKDAWNVFFQAHKDGIMSELKKENEMCYGRHISYVSALAKQERPMRVRTYACRHNLPKCLAELEYVRNHPERCRTFYEKENKNERRKSV